MDLRNENDACERNYEIIINIFKYNVQSLIEFSFIYFDVLLYYFNPKCLYDNVVHYYYLGTQAMSIKEMPTIGGVNCQDPLS